MHEIRSYAALALLGTLALTACGDDDRSLREGLAGLPRDTATAAPAPDPLIAPPDTAVLDSAALADSLATSPAAEAYTGVADREWTAGVVQATGTGVAMAMLTDVRVARQAGYDRVVFEFADGLPGYQLEYVDQPIRECGSGNVVRLEGEGWLRVRFEPARAHTEQGEPTVAARSLDPDLPVITELHRTCDFEGQVEWVIAVESPNRFRVSTLPAPPRLVVDVRR